MTGQTDSPLVVCALHKAHWPVNLTVELHHVIPVAWQLVWKPSVQPYPGKDPSGRGDLWDSRTLACCPTGHRNVHHWLTRLMHACSSEDPLQAEHAVKGHGEQYDFACQALIRWKEAGGLLQQLVAAGQWGMA